MNKKSKGSKTVVGDIPLYKIRERAVCSVRNEGGGGGGGGVKPPQMCKGPWHLCFLERPRVGPLKTPPNVKYVVHKSFKALLKVSL